MTAHMCSYLLAVGYNSRVESLHILFVQLVESDSMFLPGRRARTMVTALPLSSNYFTV